MKFYEMSSEEQEYLKRSFLEGKQIQFRFNSKDSWHDCDREPIWFPMTEYRVKPQENVYNDPSEDIEDLLDCFDFEKVKTVMDFLNWQWALYNGVPEIWDLRKHARNQLKTVAKEVLKEERGTFFTSCGGFNASARVYEDCPKIYLELEFVITDWSNYD